MQTALSSRKLICPAIRRDWANSSQVKGSDISHHDQRVRRRCRIVQFSAHRPEGHCQRARPVRRQHLRGGELVHDAQCDERHASRRSRRRQADGHRPERCDRSAAEAAGSLFELDRRLRDASPQADQRARQEHQRIGEQDRHDGLVEWQRDSDGHRYQGQGDDDAGQ